MNFLQSKSVFGHRLLAIMMMLSLVLSAPQSLLVVQAQPSIPDATPVSTLHLSVISADDSSDVKGITTDPAYGIHKGDPITNFRYIINIDNTGTTAQRSPADGCSPSYIPPVGQPGYPESCKWVSIAGSESSAPIYTQGTEVDFPGGAFNVNGITELPPGRYLISILADNYKIDGAHFTVPGSGNVTVEMQPYDLPAATLQAEVFVDNAPTNSAPDVPVERGIAGFQAHINDYIDEVTTNVYGDPLCGDGHCLSKCFVVDGGVDTGIVNPRPDSTCPFRDELAANATTADTHVAISADAVIEGKVKIPDLGPNRYALSVVPPNKSGWAQTTTLEGNHDWDAWVMEGSTGLDTEFVVAGEPFPAIFFGYIKESNTMGAGLGEIKGNALAVSAYIPPVGGIVGETGLLGAKAKDKNPIHSMYVSLSDLNNNDQTVYMQHFTCNNESGGCPFDITGVPDGDYVLGVWDEPQDFIFAEQNVSIVNGEFTDLGSISMLGWWTTLEGHVFNDLNENGKMDPGEPGIPNFTIVNRTRENSIMDRGSPTVTTDGNGYYWMESFYPMTRWLVTEAYADGFQTTGITYQADNQPTETTILGQGVDVNVHPVIGLGGRLDWGVKAYAPGTNGGIVGTVSYDTTRNELNPQYAAIEDWQPSISNLNVDLYAPVPCVVDSGTGEPVAGQICDADYNYQLEADGSYKLGNLLNQYVSETWERPSGCIARNVDGNPLAHGTDEQVLPTDPNAPCLEAPMMGMQFGPMADNPNPSLATNFGASVDGNYGFGDGCFNLDGTPGVFDPDLGDCSTGSIQSLPSNTDYLVKVEIPNDAFNRPLYQVTKEEDINIANGDSFVPQVPPPACAGVLHTVDVAGDPTGHDNYGPVTGAGYDVNGLPIGVTVPGSTPVDNPTLANDLGGTIYEGQQKPLCDVKLVHVSDRKSIAPGFNLFTDVPLPGRFWGLTIDDLNFSSDPKSTAYGEKLPVAFNPVGIYDYTNRLIDTVETDYNGFWDVLLPSTNRISCPTPSGVCANLYRFVGNDPGTPGHWNPNYNPQYRSIAAEFEAFPGLTLPADLAPTPVAVAVQIPNTQTITAVSCALNDITGATPATNPEFFAINQPYMYSGASARTFNLQGLAFGATAGSVTLDNSVMTINSWSDTSIQFTIPNDATPNTPAAGPHQLKITSANGKTTINALTFHVVAGNSGNSGNSSGNSYNLKVFEVGVGRTYDPTSGIRNTGDPANGIGNYEHALQDALNDAAAVTKALVVVYPGPVDPTNPRYNGRGAYYENVIMHSPVKLQGVGPGGVYPNGTPVQGSILDGIAFGGDTNLAEAFRVLALGLPRAGNQDIAEGQVIYVLPETETRFSGTHNTNGFDASIDGFDLRGGDQQGFAGNLNAIFGGFPGPIGAVNTETQGGAIFANAYASYLRITNNIVQNNGGTYGTIRIGTPNIATSDNANDHVRIANNRIIANGGTNLAGALGLFGGSDNYEVANNDFCGNFSAEYGGAISHFGRSNNGSIHDNRIYFNHSYDEGGGIIIAGELATVPTANYGQPGGPQGSGAVNIYNNLIQGNMSEDDGGGLRFLMAGNFPMNVYNNMLVNNIATHEGGGVALDDAPNVRFYNNTVMNNKTTATAITSNGDPAPAGLSTGANSDQLLGAFPALPAFSDPLLFNNIFYNNWAGTKRTNCVSGIGAACAPSTNPWDMGVVGLASLLSPTNSILQSTTGTNPSPTNSSSDPLVASTLNIPVSFTSWRTNINFIGAIMVTADLPPSLLGDYHLQRGISLAAIDHGAPSKAVPSYQQPAAPTPYQATGTTSLNAPPYDIDNLGRPTGLGYDMGADELTAASDLFITKTDGVGQTNASLGSTVIYTIVAHNNGPDAATGAAVVDTLPANFTGATWTCTATSGSSCATGSGTGNINTIVNLANGGSATFILTARLTTATNSVLANTATVSSSNFDTNPANNSATDTDSITFPAFPSLGVLDNFNRANANNLGGSWSQANTGTNVDIRINANQALVNQTNDGGQAIWNNPTAGYGANQGAAYTFANAPVNNQSLILKATGGTTTTPANYIRVQYQTSGGGQVVIATTTNSGSSFATRATFAVSFASGDVMTATATSNGNVYVYKNGVLVGAVSIPTSGTGAWTQGTGGGRIGTQILTTNARVDNFSGGTLP